MAEDYLDQLKNIPIADILTNIYGVEYKKKGTRLYCRIRPERTASCVIYLDTNSFYDFGGSVGGDTISFVSAMENCDRKTAMERLATFYDIKKQRSLHSKKELFDFEWRKLGVEPNVASANLNINVIEENEKPSAFADINLYVDNPTQLENFTKKYQVPIEELRKTDPVSYHKILKKHVLQPLFFRRDNYYEALLSDYRMAKEISNGDIEFAKEYVISNPNNLNEAKEIDTVCELLRRAVDDVSLLPVPMFHLYPKDDLDRILSGEIKFTVSKISYFELLRLAKAQGKTINCLRIPYADYLHLHMPHDSFLRKFPHSATYHLGNSTMYFFKDKTSELQKFLTEQGQSFHAFEQQASIKAPQYLPKDNTLLR